MFNLQLPYGHHGRHGHGGHVRHGRRGGHGGQADMEFVQNFTPPDFQAKNFTPSISPNFNSFSKGRVQKIKMEI